METQTRKFSSQSNVTHFKDSLWKLMAEQKLPLLLFLALRLVNPDMCRFKFKISCNIKMSSRSASTKIEVQRPPGRAWGSLTAII